MVRATPSLRCLLTSLLLATALPLAASPAAASIHSATIFIEITATEVRITEPDPGWTCTQRIAHGDEISVRCSPTASGGAWWCGSRSVELHASGAGEGALGFTHCVDDDADYAMCRVLLTPATLSCTDSQGGSSAAMATGEVECKIKLYGVVVSGVLRCDVDVSPS